MEWIKCEKRLPPMGMPVLAISHDGSSQAIPHIVRRTHHKEGWAWSPFRNDEPGFYSANAAYFNYWMKIPGPPQ